MSKLTISQKIEKELASKKAEEIEELDISDCTAESFEGLTDKLVNLKHLYANGCGLKSTDGLPMLKNLGIVDLSNNEIKDLKAVATLPMLKVLELCNCGIESMDVLEPLYNHPRLESLNLDGNDVKNTENFLDTLFANLPVLVAVDGVNDRNGSTFYENDYDETKDYESGSESGSDEEVGLDALQRSGDLEDDEEDFEPGEEDDEEDDYDDEDDEDEDGDEEEANHAEEKIGKKRKAETNGSTDPAKHKRVSDVNGDQSE